NGAVSLSTHAGVNEDLSHRVLGCGRLFPLICIMHSLDKINGVIVGNKLQRISNAIDQIILTNDGHLFSLLQGGFSGKCARTLPESGRIDRAACELASMAKEAVIKRHRAF